MGQTAGEVDHGAGDAGGSGGDGGGSGNAGSGGLPAPKTSFGIHLSKNGVAPRAAQAAMRHSTLDLTMNVYTDPELLDVAGAMEALPELAIEGAVKRKAYGDR